MNIEKSHHRPFTSTLLGARGVLVLSLAFASLAACGDDKNETTADAGIRTDAGTPNEPDCYMNPTTHKEIINACTGALHVEKNPVLPLLNADGTRPPVP